MISGLHHQLAQTRQQLVAASDRANHPNAEPRDTHAAQAHADVLGREIADLQHHIEGDLKLCDEIQQLINFLNASKAKTAHRTLALRHLEDAQSRLLRELGQP